MFSESFQAVRELVPKTDTSPTPRPRPAQIKKRVPIGNYKPGRVTATVTDLTVPAKGLAIRIQRTYDSLNAGQIGDFGYGWSLGTKVDLQVDPKNNVTFTLGGQRRTFYFTPQYVFPPFLAQIPVYLPAYTPEPGLPGTLAGSAPGCLLGGYNLWDVLVQDGNMFLCDTGGQYSPPGYIYTDQFGTQYTMGSDGTLQSIVDLGGNTLTVTAAGITSSTGLSVPFVRDTQGRITQITDPLGNQYLYSYDGNGNLTTVTYPGIATPGAYGYDANHLLTQETDRRGNVISTNAYDPNGRIQTNTDALGNTWQYAYDLTTNTTTVTNPDGGTIVTVSDAYGKPLSVTDPLNRTTTYTYDAAHNELTKTDPLGKTWTYTYDSNGNRTSATDPLGNTSSIQYNQCSGPDLKKDTLGNVTVIGYDDKCEAVVAMDTVGTLFLATYDDSGNLITLADGNSNTSQLGYDAQGHLTSITDALNHTFTATYDALGENLSLTNALGNTTSFAYNDFGRVTQTTFPDGSSASVQYDAMGNVAARADELGRTTTYTYDAGNELIQTALPDGTSTGATYDYNGRPLTRTDQAGHVTKYEYDLAGELVKVTAAYGTPDAGVTQYGYDAAGRRTSVSDPNRNVTKYSYDDAGRMIARTNALDQTTTYTYDAAGHVTAVTDPLNRTTQLAYDARGRRTTVTYPDATKTTLAYNALGQVATLTDQGGGVTSYGYDAVANLVSVTDALNHPTTYAYDAIGNLLSRTDANGHTTSYTYDSLRRMASRTLPAGGNAETFAYNPTGTLASITDFNGKTTTFAYDVLNRLLSRTPDPSLGETPVSFTYTPTGRRATMTDASGATNYAYDNRDRLLSKATPFGTLAYMYDAAGNRLSMVSFNANGTNVSYAYDALNRLQTLTDNGLAAQPNATSYTYDAAGKVNGIAYPNGVRASPVRDLMDRITSLHTTSSPAADYFYTYGPVGNRLTATEGSGRSVSYSYDALYRLIGETVTADPQSNNGALAYGLDPVGNALALTSTLAAVPAQTLTYDADDRISGASYDANGNTLAAGGKTFAYDSLNRLVNFDNGALAMAYDADGNRVAKGSTRYLVDDNNPSGLAQVAEEIVGGRVTRVYTYGLRRVSQRQLVNGAWQVSFYGYDGHGDVRFLTNAAGAVTDTYDYDAHGNLIASTGSTPNVYRYQGEAFDSETGLYYLRARYYDPAMGRFLTTDPLAGVLADPKTQHPYLYASADPENHRDPSGRADQVERALISAYVTLTGAMIYFNPDPKMPKLERFVGGAIMWWGLTLTGCIGRKTCKCER